MKWVRRIVASLFALAVVVGLVLAFRPKPARVELAVLERGEFVEWVEEPGRTRVRERFVISAPLAGELARIVKKPGDSVDAGEVLADLRPAAPAMLDTRTRSELEARVRTARAAQQLATTQIQRARSLEAHAEHELERVRALVERQAMTRRELDQAELDADVRRKEARAAELSARVADYELEVARAAASSAATRSREDRRWQVVSPLRGRVLRVLATNEGVVATGTPLLEVADTSDIEVVVSMLTTDAVRVSPGARSTIERWGGSPFEGRVRAVEPSGYTKLSALGVEEQRVDVIIDPVGPATEWAALGDGFRVQTRTLIHREADALKAPSSALFRDGPRWALFVVENNRARKRSVRVERQSGREAMIADDLAPGTSVIAFPTNALADGARVTTR